MLFCKAGEEVLKKPMLTVAFRGNRLGSSMWGMRGQCLPQISRQQHRGLVGTSIRRRCYLLPWSQNRLTLETAVKHSIMPSLAISGTAPGPHHSTNVAEWIFSNPFNEGSAVMRHAPKTLRNHTIPMVKPEKPLFVDPTTSM